MRKGKLLCAALLVAALLLGGCGPEPEPENVVVEAIVLEQKEASLLVFDFGSEDLNSAGFKDAALFLADGRPAQPEDFTYGTKIAITYSGMRQLTWPGGMVDCTQFEIIGEANELELAAAQESYSAYQQMMLRDAVVYTPASDGSTLKTQDVAVTSYELLFAQWRTACGLPDEVELLGYTRQDNSTTETKPAGSASTVVAHTFGDTVWLELTLSPASAAAFSDGGELLAESLARTSGSWFSFATYQTTHVKILVGDEVLYDSER